MTLLPCPLSYQQLVARLTLNELEIEKEQMEHPALNQMVEEEAARIGTLFKEHKIKEHELELLYKTTYAILLLEVSEKNSLPAGKSKLTVAEKEATVESDQRLLDAKNALFNQKRLTLSFEEDYNRWDGLRSSFKERSKALHGYREMILGGYVAYNRAGVAATLTSAASV